MRISDWSSDVCSSDLCASEITRIAFCRKVIALTMKNCAAGRFGVFVQSRLAACAYRMSRDPEELFPLSRTEIFISAPVRLRPDGCLFLRRQIGRASCRERVCPYV